MRKALLLLTLFLVGCGQDPTPTAATAECIYMKDEYDRMVRNCRIVTVTFKDGSACIATEGEGVVCHWISKGTETVVLPPSYARGKE